MYKLLTRAVPLRNVQWYGSPCAVGQWRHHRSSKKEKTPPASSAEFLQRVMIPVRKFQTSKHEILPYFLDLVAFYKDGTKRYIRDLRELYTMVGRMRKEKNLKLTIEELQFEKQMLSAMGKLLPVLFLLMVPGTMILILPLMHWRGRFLLPHHYLTPQELEEENVLKGFKQSDFGRRLMDVMEADADKIEQSRLRQRFLSITEGLRKGREFKASDIVPIVDLFEEDRGIFGPARVKPNYLVLLCELNGINSLLPMNRMKQCIYRVYDLAKMDTAILEEGGPCRLSDDTLKWALYYRGANASYMSKEEMQDWLHTWLKFSCEARKSSPFALLYGPIFLAYNHWR